MAPAPPQEAVPAWNRRAARRAEDPDRRARFDAANTLLGVGRRTGPGRPRSLPSRAPAVAGQPAPTPASPTPLRRVRHGLDGRPAPASGQSRPRRWAMAAASTRPAAPSLARMLETCTPTVLGLMNNAWAIWRLLRPAATSASTSTSRGVRPSCAAGAGAAAAGTVAPAGGVRSRRARRASALTSASRGRAPRRPVMAAARPSTAAALSRSPAASSASAWR
jgi:hypothetical protein